MADVAAAKRFYETVAPLRGLRLRDTPDRAHFAGASGSFSVLRRRDEPFHLAFPATDDATVRVPRGRDRGRLRRQRGARRAGDYHAGYYGAFVLDPDGHNVEVVNHNR